MSDREPDGPVHPAGSGGGPGGVPQGGPPPGPGHPGPVWASQAPPFDAAASSGGGSWAGGQPPPYMPVPPPAERIRLAVQERGNTDYIFHFWTALGWTVLTFGFYGYYVFYQLVRRMRDHNARRVELLDAAVVLGWEEAGRRGLQGELTPSFLRASSHLAVLRKMTGDFREPVIWLVLSFVAGGIVQIIAFILLDQDLVKHDRAEVGVEYELALIYGRFGLELAWPDANRVKGQHNYAGRIVATFFSFGVYWLWWYYDMMQEPNRHFRTNWVQEDALVSTVQAVQ